MSMSPRQRRLLIVFGMASGLVLFGIGILWVVLAQQREPRYRGLTVSQWSAKMGSLSSDDFAEEFGAVGSEPVPVLVQGLSFQSSPFRSAYAAIYPKLPAQLRTLFTRPVDPARVRWESAGLLMVMGADAEPAVPALIEALSDQEDSVRLGASGALKLIRPHLGERCEFDAEAVAALSRLTIDPNRGIRWNAVGAVYRFGYASTNAIPVLEQALSDPDEQVRRSATNALREIQADKEREL